MPYTRVALEILNLYIVLLAISSSTCGSNLITDFGKHHALSSITFYNATLPLKGHHGRFPQLELLASSECPLGCSCVHSIVVCAGLYLDRVPTNIPKETTRLDLQENRITKIRAKDFAGLKNLKILQLMDNQIELIDAGAFDSLVALERLRLNRNRLRAIPNHLFARTEKLRRLDLSENSILSLSDEQLFGPRKMITLQLHRNQLGCLEHRQLIDWALSLEVLTLNGNNLNTLEELPLELMSQLRILRLSDNPWHCDCRLKWFKQAKLYGSVKCHRPALLRGRNVNSINNNQMKCSGMEKRAISTCHGSAAHQCPSMCSCIESNIDGTSAGITVDCHDRGLRHIPIDLPSEAVELRLERNYIKSIPNNAFQKLHRLVRLDLSKNNIENVSINAFKGLSSLNTLMLFANNLTYLPSGLFLPLEKLQLLLLNSNKIRCLRSDIFTGLQNLQLLSLYDNQLQSIANGTFSPFLNSLQTLHLAKNELICDCNLEWLSRFLENRSIETSGVRCHAPKRMEKKRFGTDTQKFRCKGVESFVTKNAGECFVDHPCPKECMCYAEEKNTEGLEEKIVMDCSSQKLQQVPKDIPSFLTDLLLQNNLIKTITVDSGFGNLPSVKKIDLSNNSIETIGERSFDGNGGLKDLNLSGNQLRHFGTELLGSAALSLVNLQLANNFVKCLKPNAFERMRKLETLSIEFNELQEVSDSILDLLPQLRALNLAGNPFICNCRFRKVLALLKTGNPFQEELVCESPKQLHGRSVRSLDHSELQCKNDGPEFEETTCSTNDRGCPRGCTCDGNSVRCSRKNMQMFPESLSSKITELFLDGNQITTLNPDHMGNLTNLSKLDLSHNKLTRISSGAFSKLTRLSILILSYNNLRCLEPGAFDGLPQLRILSLHGNELSQISEASIGSVFHTLTHIALGSNPFWCDCEINWLSRWIKTRFVEPGIARCSGPSHHKNQMLLTASNFECTPGGQPKWLQAKCDACLQQESGKCINGGKCRSPSGDCDCLPKFYGQYCQFPIDACFGNPCLNSGSCEVIQDGRFYCRCPAGFEGEICQTKIDYCAHNKCQNGATCMNSANGIEDYQCECSSLYTGKFCEKNNHPCASSINPCNYGKCIAEENSEYRCLCDEKWTGKNCTERVSNKCLCKNGGTCTTMENSYKCQCQNGFVGELCEHFGGSTNKSMSSIFPRRVPDLECSADNCENGYCQKHDDAGKNDGVFLNEKRNYCRCFHGFGGKECRLNVAIGLQHPDSYIAFPVWPPIFRQNDARNLTMMLRTLSKKGVVAYYGDKHSFLALELYSGRVKAMFFAGNYPPSHLYSYATVNDGNEHRIEARISGKSFFLKIDSLSTQAIVNSGKVSEFRPRTEEKLFIGGLPHTLAVEALANFRLKNTSSLQGCISNVYINNALKDFRTEIVDEKHTTNGCAQAINLCLGVDCGNHGKCQMNASVPEGWECKCRSGFEGKHCEKRKFRCVKERKTERIILDGCRSTEVIKSAKCSSGFCGSEDGSSSSGCCVPTRTKRKRINLQCNDGTQKTISIDIVRKCKCSTDNHCHSYNSDNQIIRPSIWVF